MDTITLEAIPNPIILYDPDWDICYANQAALDAFGFADINDLINKSIFSLVNPEDHEKIKNIQGQLKDGTHTQTSTHLSRTAKNKKAPSVRYLSHFKRVDNAHQNESACYMESAINLEETAEGPDKIYPDHENYKILSENIPGIEVFLIDRHCKIHCKLGRESFNQGWNNNLKNGTDFFEYFTPEVLSILNPILKIAFELTPVSREFSIRNQYFSIRLIPLNPDKAGPLCVVVLQNITETKLAENKLKHSMQQAEEANRAKDSFVAKMSHEIRTPLNAVIGFSEQLTDTRLTKKQSGYLDVINNSSRHLLSIIDDILVLSKIESGNIELDVTPFRITDVSREIHQLLELRYKKKGLAFHIENNTLTNPMLLGDVAKLKQVLLNLINNAIKFTNKGHIYLRSNLVEQTSNKVKISFEVSDTGIGIAPEKINEIFKPFHQVNNSLDRNFSGCGLGLTISNDLVKSMGSDLTVKSTPGKGSIFAFTLEFRKTPEKVLSIEKKDFETWELDHNSLRILFVDDDPVNILLGKVILKKLKIKTDFASSGKNALKLYKPDRYNIIFLDINMPELNGMEVARQIRKIENSSNHQQKTAIVAMTANAVRKYLKQYLRAGMDSILLKPYSEEMLYQKILKFSKNKETGIQPGSPTILPEAKKDMIYNLNELLKITKNNREFTLLMLNTFVENSENELKNVKSLLDQKDYEKIGDVAHKLIPSVEQLGITKAAELLKLVEERYLIKKDRQHDYELIRQTVDKLQAGINAIKSKIKEVS